MKVTHKVQQEVLALKHIQCDKCGNPINNKPNEHFNCIFKLETSSPNNNVSIFEMDLCQECSKEVLLKLSSIGCKLNQIK